MATPFSPFVGKPLKQTIKRRQSELPSDLIDWDTPEIPEFEKQRIIYEDYIKELNEENDIETLLNEQIFKVAHDTVVEEYQKRLDRLEGEVTKERSRVNLMLGQIKMFESNVKENEGRVDELENALNAQRDVIQKLKEEKEKLLEEKEKLFEEKELWLEEKEKWQDDRNKLLVEQENLTFKIDEITCELNENLETYIQKKNEVEDYKKKLDAVKNQLAYYKRLAKNKDINNE